jgi:predicted esterase
MAAPVARKLVAPRLIALAAIVTSVGLAGAAHAEPSAESPKSTSAKKAKIYRAPKPTAPVPWCSEETETLPNGLCYIDGRPKDASPGDRRTLVIFLHGAIAKDVDWQWLQERALTRQAKQSKFEAIFARAPLGAGGYVWPGTKSAQEASEQELIDGWMEARAFLERRNGRPYDEVFVMGFSSGAYFVSSLALRGRLDVDGYAVFAGGAGGIARSDVTNKVPVFVGVCAEDSQTANHSRGFGAALAARSWPHRVDERRVGHMFSDVHVAHAVSWLRKQVRK